MIVVALTALSVASGAPGLAVARAPGAAASSGAPAHASIVGGREAAPGSYPWMAFVVDIEGGEAAACTGTVVAPRAILTAAHCTLNEESGALRDPGGYEVVTGTVNWADPAGRQISKVTRLIPYPKFGTAREGFGDVAVLALATPTTAPSIPIAKSPRFTRLGTRARIAGWGMTWYGQTGFTEALMWTKTVVAGSRCEGLWGRVCVVDFPKFKSGACFGDSGGPLFAFDPKRGWIEFGVTQGGFDGCTTRRPQLYTRTDVLAKWIAGRIAQIEATP